MPLYRATAAIPTGTAFPGTPTAGDRLYRTDRNIDYVYDGTRWLSTHTLSLAIATQSVVNPATVTESLFAANPHFGQYDIYVERLNFATYNGTVVASNYFTGQLQKQDTAATVSVGTAIATNGDTINQLTGHGLAIGAVIESTYGAIKLSHTETGTTSSYVMASIVYRLVG